MLQKEVMGNLNESAQYLHKDFTANIYYFFTINA